MNNHSTISIKKYSTYKSIFFAVLVFVAGAMIGGCNNVAQPHEGKPTASNLNPATNAAAYTGPGGGGAMFHPTVSPHNPDNVLVSCDMTGAYVTHNAGAKWTRFNLHSPVRFYVFDPLDSNIVYANSIALYKSTDKGATWHVLYPAATEIAGIVSKGDHAEEVVVTKDSTRRHVLALAVDPAASNKLYAAISINKNSALYFSDDGGLQWTKEKELEDGATNIFIVPNSPKEDRTLYITGRNTITQREGGVWKLNKGPQGVTLLTSCTGGFDAQQKKFIIYAMTGTSYFNANADQSGIFYTDNGGKTWQNRQDGLLQLGMKNAALPEWRAIATSALHPQVLYVSYNNFKLNKDTTCIGVAKSEDYGKTWVLAWRDIFTANGNKPSPNFKSGWLNERFGPGWGENPFAIGVAPANADICYATDFGRTIKSVDAGKTWQQVYTQKKQGGGWMSRGLEVTTSYAIVFDPFNRDHAFIATTDIGLMESNDGAESWSSATVNNGIPRSWINSTYWLTFDPQVKGKAWTAMSGTHDLPRPKMWRRSGISNYKGGILVTENSGASWQPVSADIGEAAITHILIDPLSAKNNRTLYACAFGKGVYKSTDGGKTWQQKNNGIEGKEPFAWRITRREQDGVLFLVVCRRGEDGSIGNEGDGAVYRSDDGAETWKKMLLPQETNGPMSLVVDADNPERLLLSAWGRKTKKEFTPDIGGGIFISKDEGKSWIPVLQNDQHIHDITYDPRIKTFYACGFNSAAYQSQDGGETWQRITGYDFKWGKRVDLDPRDSTKIFIITFGGGVWQGKAM